MHACRKQGKRKCGGQGFHPLDPNREWGEGCSRRLRWSLSAVQPSEGLLQSSGSAGGYDPRETLPSTGGREGQLDCEKQSCAYTQHTGRALGVFGE